MHVNIKYSIKLLQLHAKLGTLKRHKIIDNIVYFLHVRERSFGSKITLQWPKDESLSGGRIFTMLGLRQVVWCLLKMLQIVNWYRILSHQHHPPRIPVMQVNQLSFRCTDLFNFRQFYLASNPWDSPARDGDAFRTLRTSSSRTLNLLVSFRLDGGGKTMAMHQNVFYQNPGRFGEEWNHEADANW